MKIPFNNTLVKAGKRNSCCVSSLCVSNPEGSEVLEGEIHRCRKCKTLLKLKKEPAGKMVWEIHKKS